MLTRRLTLMRHLFVNTLEAGDRGARFKVEAQAPQLQAQVGAINAAAGNLDVAVGGVHAGDPAAALNHIHTKLGTHAGAAGSDTTNHRIEALHTALGHPVTGNANDDANKKVPDIATALGTRTIAPGATGPSVHEKLTDALVIAGKSRAAATDRGAGGAVLPTLIGREEALLARLKAGIAGLNANGGQYEVRTVAITKSPASTAAGQPPVPQDLGAAAAATNLHDCLAALGW